jgi:hypothetical protein
MIFLFSVTLAAGLGPCRWAGLARLATTVSAFVPAMPSPPS